jgi:hypothetical protein
MKLQILLGFLITSTVVFAAAVFDFGENAKMSEKQTIAGGYSYQGTDTRDVVLHSNLPGSQLHTLEKRSIRVIDPADYTTFGISEENIQKALKNENFALDQNVVIANFAHGFFAERVAKYYVAILPKHPTVNQVIAHEEHFIQGAGSHYQVRYKIEEPIVLVPQTETPKANWYESLPQFSATQKGSMKDYAPKIIEGDFIYSLFAIRTEGGEQDWDPIRGITGQYANSYGFTSTMHLAVLQTDHNYVEQFLIKVPHEELESRDITQAQIFQNIYEFMLKNSAEKLEKDIYNSVFSSCITAALEALYAEGKGLSKINIREFNPYKIKDHLIENGYLAQELETLNKEFDAPIQSPITDENKETYELMLTLKEQGIINSPLFDQLLLDFSYFVAKNRLNYGEVKALMGGVQDLLNGIDPLIVRNQVNNALVERTIEDLDYGRLQDSALTILEAIENRNSDNANLADELLAQLAQIFAEMQMQ